MGFTRENGALGIGIIHPAGAFGNPLSNIVLHQRAGASGLLNCRTPTKARASGLEHGGDVDHPVGRSRLGNGNGTFGLLSTVETGLSGGLEALAAGDFNGDGKLDLAVLLGTGPITILLGNGDGTFTVGSTTNDEDGPEAIRRCGF